MAELALLGTALAEGATAAGTAAAGAVGEIGLGTALSAGSSIVGGIAANEAGKAQADALRKQAQFKSEQLTAAEAEERAKATRKAADEAHKTDLVAGRRRALAAASGAGATGGSEDTTLEGIYLEGQNNVKSAIASGENRARGLMDQDAAQKYDAQTQANMARAKGSAALVSGVIGAGGKVLGNSAKLGNLWGSDDDVEEIDGDYGWRTTMRRGKG